MRVAQAKTLDPILLSAQSHNFILGVVAKDALNRVTSRFRYVNKEKTFLKRDHRSAVAGFTLWCFAKLGEQWQAFTGHATDCQGVPLHDHFSQIQIHLYQDCEDSRHEH